MKFGPVSPENAVGKILGHNIAGPDGKRRLRKGTVLSAADVALLQELGRTAVYVAELEPEDVDENTAALRVAQAIMGEGLRLSGPATGRANLLTTTAGVLRVDAERLTRLNACVGITLATMLTNTAVRAGKLVATVKVLPFAVPETAVLTVEQIGRHPLPLIHVTPLQTRQVTIILSGFPTARTRIENSFLPPLRQRLEALSATIQQIDFVPLEDTEDEIRLAQALQTHKQLGADLIILAGETAIMDEHDIAPRAIRKAGGEVACFGAPVDPGNLLMLAYLKDVPVLGAPGCVRSPKINVVDWVLPRLLVGDRLTRADIYALGHGGLLEDVPERPFPRQPTTNQ
ncbi:MAG: molybdopterin-binding protein [Chloroflexi bacterium]|nr:MAG: molybdopterin-binding protein [Chloroflexota bacterium]